MKVAKLKKLSGLIEHSAGLFNMNFWLSMKAIKKAKVAGNLRIAIK